VQTSPEFAGQSASVVHETMVGVVGVIVVSYAAPVVSSKVGSQLVLTSPLHVGLDAVVLEPTTTPTTIGVDERTAGAVVSASAVSPCVDSAKVKKAIQHARKLRVIGSSSCAGLSHLDYESCTFPDGTRRANLP
jgi:hypothetical protein